MSNHPSVRFAGLCAHLAELLGSGVVFESVLDFKDEYSVLEDLSGYLSSGITAGICRLNQSNFYQLRRKGRAFSLASRVVKMPQNRANLVDVAGIS